MLCALFADALRARSVFVNPYTFGGRRADILTRIINPTFDEKAEENSRFPLGQK
jgi:hypothetical protein